VLALTPETSAVLLDNQYGLAPAMALRPGCGLMMSYEESGYSGDSTYRKLLFDPNWTIEKIRRMGATAIKLLAYYHPHAGALTEEVEAQIADVVTEANHHAIPLFLEPMSYSIDPAMSKDSAAFAETRMQVVVDTAARLSRLKPDVLKLEFPVDAAFDDDRGRWRAGCEAISAASDVPWVLLSAGVDFSVFVEQATIACQAGASGWLAGRAIWKESVLMADDERAAFLAGEATARTRQLAEVAAQYARPWTDFYAPPEPRPDWFV
jgi:tagatose 1,6-diphosphate aldolase